MNAAVLDAWSWPSPVKAERLSGGLINQTWRVIDADNRLVAVLQRLNTEIFRPEVHEDIEAVTTAIVAAGLRTPRLVRTRSGALWHTAEDGGVYRVLTPVGDRTVDALVDPQDARSAGALVGRVHRAVRDLDWSFRMVRPGAHDTDAHMQALAAAVERHPAHRLHGEVAPLAANLQRAWAAWDGPTHLPARVVHGDLKISNIRFAGPTALAVIDLDTFALGTLDVELGDAMRSWCNRTSEDHAAPQFDRPLFGAAIAGYATGAGDSVRADEWDGIVPGVHRICLELSARFLRDALEERYFGWDPAFGGQGEHNLLRARGQAALAADVAHQRTALQAVVARARTVA